MVKLGETNPYPDAYNPRLLEAIPRSLARSGLAIDKNDLPFKGYDLWTAYEISWLKRNGLPVCYIAELYVPVDSFAICESKSLKYYLNSLNQHTFALPSDAVELIKNDLHHITGAHVEVKLYEVDDYETRAALDTQVCRLLERQVDKDDTFEIAKDASLSELAEALNLEPSSKGASYGKTELYATHLLKTNCPLTGQPDWATVIVGIKGRQPSCASLLKYLVGFRPHQDYHEHCVERIFIDLLRVLSPEELYINARYTRRGGIDINPLRHTPGWDSYLLSNHATYRQ